ncbi:MBL fold metallo-hydrolase [Deinococcus cellulosilyticus]|uniref:MBL fold metallo-hydrolase n=1 Tax=Deinococcus cellulosilyticus (strain DSM 18568 / NBRC 106333 / KACC 11606 / 5516J-15) TaxID=1223518 RepID=A0A511N0E1_DEIC1|nr:MBL fold metallo-hydrolase [Deinococcus cellulosilyticus]GEM46279.1 MBL fold metallo-hydrolase [Deinococcus cellulosilyticus NBRC 106333 = KACC 11606]
MTHPTPQDLISRIDRLNVPEGQLALWSLGQSGFVIKGGNTIFYIDPYLSDSIEDIGGPRRRFPIPADPSQIHHASAVFATHEHMDHADGPTLGPLMQASPQATLVTSWEGRDVALQAGVPEDRIVVPVLGEALKLGDLTYTAIPAAHYQHELRETGHARWMGFLIECGGVTVYHSGDTIVIPELLDALKGKHIDLALLPINGRDFHRESQGLVGNLWPGEAIELAVLIGAKVLIGTHNDLFDGNRVNPGMLFDELDRRAPFQRCHLLQPGELYLFAE